MYNNTTVRKRKDSYCSLDVGYSNNNMPKYVLVKKEKQNKTNYKFIIGFGVIMWIIAIIIFNMNNNDSKNLRN